VPSLLDRRVRAPPLRAEPLRARPGPTAPVRVVVVTGASSGIGAATSRRLPEHGYRVRAVARRADRLAGLAHGSVSDPRRAGITPVAADLTDDASLVVLVERVRAETGRVDVLVNNAGYGAYGAVEDVPLNDGRAQFEVNLFASARLVQLVLPAMRERGSDRIINVSSLGGKIYEPMGSWYHSTKYRWPVA
jgi:short-subunit dehydrogenase